jgi:hypothetical protein
MGRKRVAHDVVARKREAKRVKRARQGNAPSSSASPPTPPTPPPAATPCEAFFVLPAGAVAKDVGGAGWCLAYAVFDQLRRLGVEVPGSVEEFLTACFGVLLGLSDAKLRELGVEGGRDTVREEQRKYVELRQWNSRVADVLVAVAVTLVLNRPVVVYTGGERGENNDFNLPVGHGTLESRVFRPENAAVVAGVAGAAGGPTAGGGATGPHFLLFWNRPLQSNDKSNDTPQ